jgi:hypothetical protein
MKNTVHREAPLTVINQSPACFGPVGLNQGVPITEWEVYEKLMVPVPIKQLHM